jgi:predicted dehydrogenase
MKARNIAMLGGGFIGDFYTHALHGHRRPDRVRILYSRSEETARQTAERRGIPRWTTDMKEAVNHPGIDAVVVALPNFQHLEAVRLAAEAGKAVLVTKPLGRNAGEATEMLELVEKHGVFHGYLEDLVYTPKTLKAKESVKKGALGDILWVRSRETHPGPHSDWFWKPELSGGGVLLDMGCHCIEIARNYIGKEVRPLEVMCWADTQVKPIEAEDHAIGLVRYASGAIGQFEVSWCFRGGMDLRDEVMGVEGTLFLNHFLRTGFEVYTAAGEGDYIAEKAESSAGWLFPVGDEVNALGYDHMFTDMFDAMDGGREPMETFYDGYVVNAVMDACYRSAHTKKWETVELELWRGSGESAREPRTSIYDESYFLVKEEKMPDGTVKLILKDRNTGEIIPGPFLHGKSHMEADNLVL